MSVYLAAVLLMQFNKAFIFCLIDFKFMVIYPKNLQITATTPYFIRSFCSVMFDDVVKALEAKLFI